MEAIAGAEIHWYEAHGIGRKDIKISFLFRLSMKRRVTFVVCLDNTGYLASLEIGKLYRIVPDEKAAEIGGVRVIDEDGEDYLYDSKCLPVASTPIVAQTLNSLSKQG